MMSCIFLKENMGSFFSSQYNPSNYISSHLDDVANVSIFHPPSVTNKNDFKSMNTDNSKLMQQSIGCFDKKLGLTEMNKDETVSFVTITPNKKNQFPDKWIVFSHGNGSDIYGMYEYGLYLANTLNIGIVMYDYLGYGLSTGNPSEY